MSEFRIRAEDLKDEEILSLFVETAHDREIVNTLKSPTPVVLEGSRGTGKSFLLRVARCEQLREAPASKILPVYVSFSKSSLIHTDDERQFVHWMLARLCADITRQLHRGGYLVQQVPGLAVLSGGETSPVAPESRIEQVARAYEDSYKRPGTHVDPSLVPDVDELKLAIEDLCGSLGIARLSLYFDEAAHIFRPAQQRSFFTLFRDLRSPYICCNAAVYPSVTSYGPTFEKSHDATFLEISRSVLDEDYRRGMQEIVEGQADSTLLAVMDRNRELFFAMAYAVSGNPRLLLKTIARVPTLRTRDVKSFLKEFYRQEIWSDHSALAERYAGHRELVDWGRQFVEKSVIPETRKKNEQRGSEGKDETTCYFWLHRDAPEAVRESLRLLAYTGIVRQMDSGVVATRGEIGTRYSLKLGALAAPEADPVSMLTRLGRSLNIKRFTEYGANHQAFQGLTAFALDFSEPDMSSILQRQLDKSVDCLDLTHFQVSSLKRLGFDTMGKALEAEEESYRQAHYIGPKRSRRMKNAVVSSVLEYLSG